MSKTPILKTSPLVSFDNIKTILHCPHSMPMASAFLWNPKMMLHVNCRGYANAQFMQPEPAKYAHAPTMEAQTFMQPEQPYYDHHPGRFFYIKDLVSSSLFSAPFKPVGQAPDLFEFIADQDRIEWHLVKDQIKVELSVSLSSNQPLELWQIKIKNQDKKTRKLSITPYFPVGYASWMNQSGAYNHELQSVICRSITPYQKYQDYFKNQHLKDLTFLLAETAPDSWEARQSAFEGDGGLQRPSALEQASLTNSDSVYETPTAAMQYRIKLNPDSQQQYRFVFGPAKDDAEIRQIREQYFQTPNNVPNFNDGFDNQRLRYQQYIAQNDSAIEISTPDKGFDHFVNHWLARQVFYHGDCNRLSTDPQTRNYLQDTMGFAYLKPHRARQAFITALSQQLASGAMPDGILLTDEAELKYINQVPHMDHCVWLPISLSAYLEESNDYSILTEKISFADSDIKTSVYEHICRAMRWLLTQRDERGLNYIAQGDWCDPMNMVGYKGKGVSSWLTFATAYACKIWAEICDTQENHRDAQEFKQQSDDCNNACNQHCWHEHWYGRGITDDGLLFGIKSDPEGQLFLNPQSWAMLSGAANKTQEDSLIRAIDERLETPYGPQMLAPCFTKMREDIGRVTQKHPGTAENGSVYNHASAFYAYALYQKNHSNRAFQTLRRMIPDISNHDLKQRGQMPVFIPNYYRGAFRSLPRTAGRSSQLFNTGTVHWFYRCLIDGLFGLKGCRDGMLVAPKLPSSWNQVLVKRHFRGAHFNIEIKRCSSNNKREITVNNTSLSGNIIREIKPGAKYLVKVLIPNE